MGRDSTNPKDEQTTEQASCEEVIAPCGRQSVKSSGHELRLYSDEAAFVNDFALSIEAALESGNAVFVDATE